MGTAGVHRSPAKPAVAPEPVKSPNGKRTRQKPGHRQAVSTNGPEAFIPFSARVSSKARISPKGQLTLPMLVRERLGVGAGDQVEFFFDGERTVVRPVRSEENPFLKWIGIAKHEPGFDTDAWISEMREGDDEYRREELRKLRENGD